MKWRSKAKSYKPSTLEYEADGVKYTHVLGLHPMKRKGLDLEPNYDAVAVETAQASTYKETVDDVLNDARRGRYPMRDIGDHTIPLVVLDGLQNRKPVFFIDTFMIEPLKLRGLSLYAVIIARPVATNFGIVYGLNYVANNSQGEVATLAVAGILAFEAMLLLQFAEVVRLWASKKMSRPEAHATGFIGSLIFPTICAFRNALAADKLEKIAHKLKEVKEEKIEMLSKKVEGIWTDLGKRWDPALTEKLDEATKRLEDLQAKQPHILMYFGAAHAGIRTYLKHPKLRRFFIKVMKPFGKIFDEAQYDQMGEVGHEGTLLEEMGTMITHQDFAVTPDGQAKIVGKVFVHLRK